MNPAKRWCDNGSLVIISARDNPFLQGVARLLAPAYQTFNKEALDQEGYGEFVVKKLTVEYYIPAIDQTYQKTIYVQPRQSMLEAAQEAVRQHLREAAVFASAVIVSLTYKTGHMTSRMEINEIVLQEEEVAA